MPVEPDDSRVEAELREYLRRIDRGERVDVQGFVAERPEIANALRARIMETQSRGRSGIHRKHAAGALESVSKQGLETAPPRPGEPLPLPAEPCDLPEQFGRYRILRTLGRGAMGTVYLAEDAQLGRRVALKTPHFQDDPTGAQLSRFYREARTAATLRHPNLCPVYDVGEINGKHYISMAFIEGHPLTDFIRTERSYSDRQILILIRKLAQALQEAHEHGIVHRDLKPANVMVDKRAEPILMDFGLASQRIQQAGDIRLTQSGALVGTPAYMSPEQVEGDLEKIGPATDQYSLGVVLYELLTGELPFRGSIASVLGQIVSTNPKAPTDVRANLDLRIESACLKMMAKNPGDRFPSLVAVADELAAILKNPSGKLTKSASAIADSQASGTRAAVQHAVTPSELVSLEELARKCYSRRDYDQVVQVIERIPEDHRNPSLESLLLKARNRTDEIAYLITEIDEAIRFNDRRTALQKAEELLRIKPGHHRARQVQEEFRGFETRKAARIGVLQSFTRPWSEGGWIPWSVLGFGLLVFGSMTIAIQSYLSRSKPLARTDVSTVEVESKAIPVERFPQRVEEKNVDGLVAPAKVEKPAAPVLPAVAPKMLVAPFTEGSAKAAQSEWAQYVKSTPLRTNTIGMEMAIVPPGEFMMGNSPEDIARLQRYIPAAAKPNYGKNQGPKHRVRISRPFYVGVHEVTRGQYAKFVSATNYKTDAERDGQGATGVDEATGQTRQRKELSWKNAGFPQDENHPVVNVSRNDADAFCEWLSRQEKRNYRLPTEAEWEYACRAGTTTFLSNGDELDEMFEVGNFNDASWKRRFPPPPAEWVNDRIRDGHVMTAPVGSFRPNQFGLFDMHGNVWEWCQDAADENYYARSPLTDPLCFNPSVPAIARGGAFECPPRFCLSAYRSIEPKDSREVNRGFRVVCNAADSDGVATGENRPSSNGSSHVAESARSIQEPPRSNEATVTTSVSIASGNVKSSAAGRHPGEARIVQHKTSDWNNSKTDYARYDGSVLEVGMGAEAPGWGYGALGLEIENVRSVAFSLTSSGKFKKMDDATFAGLRIDYHTPGGYTKRVAFTTWNQVPTKPINLHIWGHAGPPAKTVKLGLQKGYDLDLQSWAPSDWDGNVWFTLMVNNTGNGTKLQVRSLKMEPRE